jgi:hypothetical protein
MEPATLGIHPNLRSLGSEIRPATKIRPKHPNPRRCEWVSGQREIRLSVAGSMSTSETHVHRRGFGGSNRKLTLVCVGFRTKRDPTLCSRIYVDVSGFQPDLCGRIWRWPSVESGGGWD